MIRAHFRDSDPVRQIQPPRWIVTTNAEPSQLIAVLPIALSAAQVKRILRPISDTLDLELVAVKEHRGPRGNPTLVHHGLAKAARWHVVTASANAPIADLYGLDTESASRITEELATITRVPMLLLSNFGQPRAIGDHSMVRTRRGSPVHRPGQLRRNPAGAPVKGEIWTTRGGGKGRVKAVTPTAIQVYHLGTGNDEWIQRDEFAATYRPPRGGPPTVTVRNRKGRNPSRSRAARMRRGVVRGATATRRQRRAVAGGRVRRFGWLSGQRSERIARRALRTPNRRGRNPRPSKVLKWNTYGAGADFGERHNYDSYTPWGQYHVMAVTTASGRPAGYRVSFTNQGPERLPESMHQAGLWRELGVVRSPGKGKALAKAHHLAVLEAAHPTPNPKGPEFEARRLHRGEWVVEHRDYQETGFGRTLEDAAADLWVTLHAQRRTTMQRNAFIDYATAIVGRRTPNPKGRAVIDSEWKARREARRKWGRGAQVWSGGVVGNKTFVVGVLTHAGSAFQAIGSGDSWEAAFTDAKGKRRPKPNPKGVQPGQRVAAVVYGEQREGVVVEQRSGGLVWVRWDGSPRKTWMHLESLTALTPNPKGRFSVHRVDDLVHSATGDYTQGVWEVVDSTTGNAVFRSYNQRDARTESAYRNKFGSNPRAPFQVGEHVTVPYTGPASVFGRKVARTREHATIQGVNDDGTVLVVVKRGRGHEQHSFPAGQARRLPQRGVKATGARVGRAKARLELKDLRARQRAATGEVSRLAAEAECLEARAKLMDPESPEYRNATARLGRLLTVLDAERMIAGELERADPAYSDPFAVTAPAPNPKGRKNPIPEADKKHAAKLIRALGFDAMAREVEQGKAGVMETLRALLVGRLLPASRKVLVHAALSTLERGYGSHREMAGTRRAAFAALARETRARTGPNPNRRGRKPRTRKSPGHSGELARTRRLFRQWNSDAAPRRARLTRVRVPARPRALARLGELVSVTYESDKFSGTPDNPKGRKQLYEHETKRPRPVLATDQNGHVHLVGGRMRPTADGLIN